MKKVTEVPVGGTRRFLVKMNNNPFASFDTSKQAHDYADMQRKTLKGAGQWSGESSKMPDDKKAFCAKQNWSVEDRG